MKLTEYDLFETFIAENTTDCVLRITKAFGFQELASPQKPTGQNSWRFKYLTYELKKFGWFMKTVVNRKAGVFDWSKSPITSS